MKSFNLLTSTVVVTFVIIMVGCDTSQTENTTQNADKQVVVEQTRFFKPPIPKLDVRFSEYVINTETDDTIMHPSGSVIIFPKNSLIDNNGNPVKGKVTIKYREFTNPIDFIFSGIPMQYDSAGVTYTFESMGMMEMYAYQGDNPVFVNNNSNQKPVVHIAINTFNEANNTYYLDTVKGEWTYEGKAKVTDLAKEKEKIQKALKKISTTKVAVEEPVKPAKESGRPSFFITIDESSAPELKAYDKLMFEITEREDKYNSELAKII